MPFDTDSKRISLLGDTNRPVCRSAKKLDRVPKAAEIEKARAIKLVAELFIFGSEIQRQNYNKEVLNALQIPIYTLGED